VKNKFWFITLAVLIIASMTLVACGPAETEAPPAEEEVMEEEEEVMEEEEEVMAEEEEEVMAEEEEEVMEEEEMAEPTKITYIDVSGFYTLDIFQTPWFTLTQSVMYDAIVTLKLDGSGYVGILAESWDVAEDGMALTFYLREGVTFHDGTPWNAEAAKWNLDKYLDPEWPKEVNQTWPDVVESIEIVDDMTIVINMLVPNATIFADLYITYMVSPTAYEALGFDEFGLAPVGTGAYIPIEIVPNDHVLYERNPDYTWGLGSGGPAVVDFFEIKYLPDEAVAYAALETGEATYIDLPAQFLATAQENADMVVNKGTSGSLNYLGINYTKDIYQVEEFRMAIAHAVERDEIVLAAFEGEAFATAQFLPAGTPGYRAETEAYAAEKFAYDPALSNQILDDLGWVDTNGDGVRERDGEELVFPFNFFTDEATGRAAEVIQGQLLDIGIMLELGPMEAAAQAEMLVAEQHEFFIRGYGYPDPVIISWMTYYPNRNALNNPDADALAAIADSTMDPAARFDAVDDLNRWLIDTYAWFPIWTPFSLTAIRSELKGVIYDFQGYPFFLDAYYE
jgi:peptide/nickel transport system substrate-binding protein